MNPCHRLSSCWCCERPWRHTRHSSCAACIWRREHWGPPKCWNCSPRDPASHLRRLESSLTPLWQPQTSLWGFHYCDSLYYNNVAHDTVFTDVSDCYTSCTLKSCHVSGFPSLYTQDQNNDFICHITRQNTTVIKTACTWQCELSWAATYQHPCCTKVTLTFVPVFQTTTHRPQLRCAAPTS